MLVMAHINAIIPDPLQFAYCPNIFTYDVIRVAHHTFLTHLDKRNTYVTMHFLDYSSELNTILPSKLIANLRTLGLNTSQVMRVGNYTRVPFRGACLVPSCTPTNAWSCTSATPPLSVGS
jgi:hypothetical protein